MTSNNRMIMEAAKEVISSITNDERKYQMIRDIYGFVKSIQSEYYNSITDRIDPSFHFILRNLWDCELALEGSDYIIESTPILSSEPIERSCQEDTIMDKIVFFIRSHIAQFVPEDISTYPLQNWCASVSENVQTVCDSIPQNIQSKRLKINPGFTSEEELFDGQGFHFFNVISIGSKKYIVDCTYRQFLVSNVNIIEKLGIMKGAESRLFLGPVAGTFMIMDQERKALAHKLARDGWIEYNEKNLKLYLDGFAIANRNGLYYEQTNDFSFTTPYQYDDYLRFLEGSDSQLRYEDREVLGYQKKPLQNPNLKFTKNET